MRRWTRVCGDEGVYSIGVYLSHSRSGKFVEVGVIVGVEFSSGRWMLFGRIDFGFLLFWWQLRVICLSRVRSSTFGVFFVWILLKNQKPEVKWKFKNLDFGVPLRKKFKKMPNINFSQSFDWTTASTEMTAIHKISSNLTAVNAFFLSVEHESINVKGKRATLIEEFRSYSPLVQNSLTHVLPFDPWQSCFPRFPEGQTPINVDIFYFNQDSCYFKWM